MKKVLKKIFNVFTDILLIAALTILVLSAYTAHQYQADPDNAYLFGYKPILVLTGSMEPTMRVNSICIAEKSEYDDIVVDDIILFQIDDKLITHRVISITDQGIRTKGDNNNSEDAYYLTEDNVKAKVVYVANWTATVIDDLQTTEGKIKWIGFPLFVLAILIILKMTIKKILTSPDEDDEKIEDKKVVESNQIEESQPENNDSQPEAPPEVLEDSDTTSSEESESE